MKVVIIENDKMVTSLVERYLADSVFKLKAIKSYDETLHFVASEKPDLVILDFAGKTSKGEGLLPLLRSDERFRQIPVIAITGFISAKELQSVIDDKLTSVLIKPFTESLFVDTLKKSLRSKMLRQMIANAPAKTSEEQAIDKAAILEAFSSEISRIEEKRANIVAAFLNGPAGLPRSPNADPSQRPSVAERLAMIKNIPVKSALIVDHDQSVLNLIMTQLKKKNVLEIVATKDGNEAWDHYSEEPLDLVMLDWEMDGLSTLALYNRIRSEAAHRYKPLLILNGNPKGTDFDEVTREDACVAIIQKPFSPEALVQTVAELVGRSVIQQECEAAVFEYITKLSSKHLNAASIRDICNAYAGTERALLKTMDRHIETKEFTAAEIIGKYLIDKPGFDVNVASRLSKIFQNTGRLEIAFEILQCANILSPDNLERLLQAGEVGLERMQIDEAKTYLGKVLSIDSNNQRANAGMFVAETLEELASTGTEDVGTGEKSLLSSLNAIGVNFAKQKKIKDAEKYYASAMMFVRDPMDKARLAYNMGLAYLRDQNPMKAYKFFEQTDQLAEGKFEKVKKYLDQLKKK